jgi:hypothetical protein
MWLIWGRRKIRRRFWLRILKERYLLEKLGVDGRTTLKWILKK